MSRVIEVRVPEAAAAPDLRAEIVVLGSGPGGYTAAFRAADLGKDVVLVERYAKLGGVCLNVGCIPSKSLLHAARLIDEAASFAEHGISFGEPSIDLAGLRNWKDSVVDRLTRGLAEMAKKRKVRVLQGSGRFSSPHELLVETADGPRTVAFEQAIIAAGSQSLKLPGFPYDDPRLMDSTAARELAEVAARWRVRGGGVSGLAMATVYHALGTKITVVELLAGLIPGCDADLVRPLHRRLAKRYENIFVKSKVTRIEPENDGLRVFFEGKKTPESDVFDRILLSVGRRPNGREIGAEKAGIEVTEAGFIPTDKQLRTNVAHIFAIGDVTGPPMLAHKATHEGKVAAEVAAGLKSAFDARVIPSVAYTDPEVAWVGVTEEEAKEKGIAYGVGTFPWSASGRSLSLGRNEGKTKLLFAQDTDRIIGAGIVGPNAGDLISEVALAIEMGCDAQDVALTVHPHPTLSETVAMSAEAFEGTLTDLYLPRSRR
ncbi:MAG: dihydrolipoyl dehydrogenase [bacterium]|nr:dihydrolipoyl dehydrogenase [bacterium]